jgi:hypothetical protein
MYVPASDRRVKESQLCCSEVAKLMSPPRLGEVKQTNHVHGKSFCRFVACRTKLYKL